MTREAKIGMLTGLGVIILIGVLLSNYLGNGNGMLAGTTRMAALPAGESYREQVLHPMGVPAAAAPGHKTQRADGTEVATPIDTNNGMMPIPLMMADVSPANPVIGPAVMPQPAGPVRVAQDIGAPPTIEMADPRAMVDVRFHTTVAAEVPAMQAVSYEILPGDNLAKIARKFYGSSKNSDVTRIVKANPDQLKDADSMLMAGKKLTIPNAQPAPVAKPAVTSQLVTSEQLDAYRMRNSKIVVPLPGDVQTAAQQQVQRPGTAVATATPVAPSAKTYTVKPGDSLRQIAVNVKTGNQTVSDVMKKIQTLNNLGNPDALKAGTTLKLP
jgi:nucleoid-associated protein YgaU